MIISYIGLGSNIARASSSPEEQLEIAVDAISVPIHLYYPGSPKPNEKLNEEMTLVDAGLQAQVGLPII